MPMEIFDLLGVDDGKIEVFHPWLPAWAYLDGEIDDIQDEFKWDRDGWYEEVKVDKTQYYDNDLK